MKLNTFGNVSRCVCAGSDLKPSKNRLLPFFPTWFGWWWCYLITVPIVFFSHMACMFIVLLEPYQPYGQTLVIPLMLRIIRWTRWHARALGLLHCRFGFLRKMMRFFFYLIIACVILSYPYSLVNSSLLVLVKQTKKKCQYARTVYGTHLRVERHKYMLTYLHCSNKIKWVLTINIISQI